ncbi:phage holin family protein [Actinomadura barringtoniae]|uniref:Phage holin family protein n=1 Tax=Actinomadura barringtoniae TaxID=1427535 RepID=A0A939PM90_9ACTN|nr:phage holin family protein [Actinomadura barringtoniae]MBO2455532.1 phage holin family protein [Actinomadura barringtoniae]
MTEALPGERIEDKSLGELVALASSNVSNLIRSEMDLAKLELKDDAKKAALGSTMFAVAGLCAGMIVILLSIALAYGLVAMGIWHWAAFLIVSGVYALLALVLIGIGYLRMKKIDGAKRSRRQLREDFSMLRKRGEDRDEDRAVAGPDARELTD